MAWAIIDNWKNKQKFEKDQLLLKDLPTPTLECKFQLINLLVLRSYMNALDWLGLC